MAIFGDFGSTDSASQIRTGLTAMLVLSLECLLEGLVTEAPIRAWLFHAVVVGLVLWTLIDPSDVLIRSSSAFGLVAVGNEGLMVAEAGAPIRYLFPSAVLFGAAAWVLQRSIAVSSKISHEVTYEDPLFDSLQSDQQLISAFSSRHGPECQQFLESSKKKSTYLNSERHGTESGPRVVSPGSPRRQSLHSASSP